MYDDEEDIKRKRKKLIYIIVAIIVLILILLIFLLTRGRGKRNTAVKMPECTLEVKEGTKNEENIYTSTTVIGFKEVTPSSNDVPITKQTVGITDSPRNKDTYTITKQGDFTVYGYIQDANGNTGTCSITVKVSPTEPTCELEVQKGIQGENGWYVSDVVVGFKEKSSNSETVNITKYYIEEDKIEINSNEVVRNDPPKDNMDEYTITKNQITSLTGYVIDESGNEGKCTIKINKDSENPSCSLKVNSGTQNDKGLYTSNVEVGFESAEDNTSSVISKGIGISKNYTEEVYTVTKEGETTVYGYVKDGAGNEGSCELTVKKEETTTTPDPPTPTKATLSCVLELTGTKVGEKYQPGAIVKFKSMTTTGTAPITEYGIDTTPKINGKNTYTVITSGTTTLYGMIKDSFGNTGTCGPMPVNILPLLSSKVNVGDAVIYDAGTWDTTVTVPNSNGMFGGYLQGLSKNTNSAYKCRKEDSNTQTGWRVLSVSNGTVTIVHAGTPECYYHGKGANAANSVKILNDRAAIYANNFAQSARMMDYNDFNSAPDTIKNIENHYYLATAEDSTDLWYVTDSGRTDGGSMRANGVRPVIVLKNNIYTTDEKQNEYWPLYLEPTTKSSEEQEIEIVKSFSESISEIINNIFK